jgi:dTDP-4-dehydrorhamnose 3,5-epimerase
MKIVATAIPEVKIVEPAVFGDARGFFLESYNERLFAGLGIADHFVQDNHSKSRQGVLRGLHYQLVQPQGKLVRMVVGEIFDVVVDMRRKSPWYGKWVGERLNAQDHRMLWVPPGFAHGFVVLSESAEVLYKATDYYAPQHERSLLWNDPVVGIEWPLPCDPILSDKDRAGTAFSLADAYD